MPRPEDGVRRLPILEGLVVICLIAFLWVTFLPDEIGSPQGANLAADKMQLLRHHGWITAYRERFGTLPPSSGHKFVLAPWVSGIVERTPVNLSMYFTPGLRDLDDHYQELMRLPVEEVWKDLAATTSEDTHYAGRSQGHRTTGGRNEAWMANDNEGGWSHRKGEINVLLGDGRVITLRADVELKEYGAAAGPVDVGPASSHPLLQQLEK